MKGVTAIIAILVLLIITVTATGAGWLSLQSAFINSENIIEFEILSESIQCSDGTMSAEIINTGKIPFTNDVFISAEIKNLDSSYDDSCYSCLKLKSPLEENQKTVFFIWDCPNTNQQSCSAGTYIISFKTKYKTIEKLVTC
ncbi:MAG: hypothetical protein ABIF08_00450 [Nanoarchaeota archaeon]